MFERAPNGFFVRDLIVFNLLRRGGYVAKGFVFEAPDLTNSQVADLNDFRINSVSCSPRFTRTSGCKCNTSAIPITRGNCCATNRRRRSFPMSGPTFPQRTVRALLAGHVRTQTPPAARHLLHLALAGKRAEIVPVQRRPARVLPHAARPA
jgi:hypothetical protein